MRIVLLATDLETRNYYITLAVLDALKRHPAVELALLATYGDAAAMIAAERCDCFFAIGGAGHQPELLARLCRLAGTSILWASEDPYEITENTIFSDCFDHIFTNDSASVAAYGGRATAMPFAASAMFHDYPVLARDEDYRYDLLFVGTAWPNRVRTINKVLARLDPDLRVKIALPANEFLPSPSTPLPAHDVNWRCSNAEFARLANVSRVTLALERDFTSNATGRSAAETPPPRLFETALAGGYQILLSRHEAVASFYTPGAEIAVCRDEAEIMRAIAAALADPAARMRRAAAARRRTQQQHLYDHRIAAMLTSVMARAKQKTALPAAAIADPPRRRNVLVVTHNLDGMKPGGGVEAYQEELPRMSGGFTFTFLVPSVNGDDNVYRVRRPDGTMFDYLLPSQIELNALNDRSGEMVFQRILVECDIDLVHFQHLIGYPLSLPLIAAAFGVPTVWTIHDYYLICKRFNLVDHAGKFCDIAARSKVNCDICLTATENLPAGSQGRRMSFLSHVVRQIDAFVASTPYSGRYLRRIYPEIPESRMHLIEMLVPGDRGTAIRGRAGRGERQSPTEKLRVVIPGNFTDGKGAHQLIRLMNLMRHRNVEFTILGYVHPDFAEILRILSIENLHLSGKYNAADSVGLMAEFEVSLHLSVWPETFMITLSEAWMAGLVPIVSALGAPGDRVTNGVDGFVVDPLDIGGIVELLEGLIADRSQLSDMQAAVAQKPGVQKPGIQAGRHLTALRSLYEDLIARRPLVHAAPRARRRHGRHVFSTELGARTNSPFWDRADNLWDPAPVIREEAAAGSYLDDIPLKYAALPQIALDGRQPVDGNVSFDDLRADNEAVKGLLVRGGRELMLTGWAFAANQGELRATYLRVTGNGGVTWVIPMVQEPRPDVGRVLSDPLASSCGFNLTLNLRTLVCDDYDVDLIQAYDDVVVTFVNVMSLYVVRGEDQEAVAVTAMVTVSGPAAPRPAATPAATPVAQAVASQVRVPALIGANAEPLATP